MAFTPSSVVFLLGTPLDIKQKNQIKFTSVAAQNVYFSSVVTHSYDNFQYSRKDGVLKIPAHIDTLYDSNYVMYQNSAYGVKWFYAFIVKMEYVNDNCTNVYIKTDVYQTWLFDTEVKPSFVVREHLSAAQDYVGANLVDEGLETGDYIYRSNSFSYALGAPAIMVGTTVKEPAVIGGDLLPELGSILSNVYTGVAYRVYDRNSIGDLNYLLEVVAKKGKADAITSMFMFPSALLGAYTPGQKIVDSFPGFIVKHVAKNLSDIDGYVPKNKKLFTHPYNFLYMSNNSGNKAEYKWEYFDTDATFWINGNIGPNPTVYCIPCAYKGVAQNYEESLTITGFPFCNWTYDAYRNWLAQNAVSVALGVASSGVSIAAGAYTGNAIGVASGVIGVAQQLGQVYQHSLQPPQAKGNTNGGGAAFSLGMLDFSFIPATITAQYAERIDNYFEMFGYKVNALKVPNLASRPIWNYIKTIDINIVGAIPNEDMAELKNMYDDGLTLWHSPSYVCNYGINNH